MRIRIWPGRQLSVWERQNPAAVTVRLARSEPREPVRRVLSMPGWMLLLVRYDWRDKSLPLAEDPATSPVVLALTKEYHRRVTHMQVTEALPEDEVADGALMQLSGEVMGLRGALGIALGWEVTGFADEAAAEHYRTWVADKASEWSRCRCPRCAAALSGEGL